LIYKIYKINKRWRMWRMWRMIWSSADASCSEDYGITPKASSILHIFHGTRIALFS